MSIEGMLFGGLFFGVGIFLTVRGIQQFKRAQATKNWTRTTATITTANMRTVMNVDSRNGRRNVSANYVPEVAYTYTINGAEYTSNNITANNHSYGGVFATRKLLSEFSVGASVPAWYDPTVPADAVLKQGLTFGDYTSVGVGLLFSVIGLGVVILAGFA